MYGIESIAANNGWAISVVGVSIVFTGLVLLALSISRIHKLLAIWDNRGNIQWFKKEPPKTTAPLPQPFTEQEKGSARQFYLLIQTMDDPFSLQRLLRLAEISGLERPHSSLARLIKTEIIKPDLHGLYLFDKETFNRFVF